MTKSRARRPFRNSRVRGAGRTTAFLLFVTGTILILSAAPAGAHPLGNFTINTAVALTVTPDEIGTRLVIDMAEIPALQTKQRLDTDKDQTFSSAERSAYRAATCASLAPQLGIAVDGRPLSLGLVKSTLTFPPGQAGLTTLRLDCRFSTEVSIAGRTSIEVRPQAFTDRVGWREITMVGDRMTLESDVPDVSPSQTLTTYPSSKLQSPLRVEQATASVIPGGPTLEDVATEGPSSPLPRGVDAPTRAFASFVGRQDLGLGVGAAAIALSLLLGAIHALAPGHGKTVMAAYLVGQKGSPRQAAALGLTVTATHTLGVLALGIAIAASRLITPEKLYPYLGVISGLLLAAIGLNLLRNARRARRFVSESVAAHGAHSHHEHAEDDHDHPHDHPHDHELVGAAMGGETAQVSKPGASSRSVEADGDWHAHGGSLHRHAPIVEGQPLTWSSLLALGFVGGFLPSPSAVVVLLGAIALDRAWFGVLLVIAYGLGMAGTLMAAGLLLVRARGALEHRLNRMLDRNGSRVLNTLLPFGTAIVIIVVGLVLAAQGANSIGG